MEKEFGIIKMDLIMKDNSLIEKKKEKELNIIRMEQNMMANGKTI